MTFRPEDCYDLRKNFEDYKLQELCGTQVPENEMKVLSNGRLTCLICPCRPIFDTLNVLLVHRRGKKHATEYHLYLARKEVLKFENLKEKQKSNCNKRALNCEKISKKMKFQRRPVLELPSFLNKTQKNTIVETTNSSSISDIAAESKGVSSIKHKLSRKKKIFPQKTSSKLELDRSTQLIMSGWMKDSSGNWVKDPNAEFDSDEEESPLEIVEPD